MHVEIGRSIKVSKLDYASRELMYAWQGTVISATPTCIVVRAPFLWSSTREPPVIDGVPFLPGDIFTEFYYLDRWYNVFHIADAHGELKGWYCNVAEPATLDAEGLSFVDMCLDLFVHPDGAMAVLDEDEYETAIARAHCADDPACARAALQTLIELAQKGQLPLADGA